MKQAEADIDRRVDAILAGLRERDEIDVISEVSYPLSLGVIGGMLGVDDAILPLLGRLSRALEDFIGGALSDPDRRTRARGALAELDGAVEELIRERLATPRPDLLTDLAQGVERGDLTVEELRATTAMIVFAGHGTTTHLIGNGTLALIRNPAAAAWVAGVPGRRAPGDRGRGAAALRLAGPEPGALPEGAGRDRRAGGGNPASGCFQLVGSANHDETVFDRPEELRLDRAPNRHLSFGWGIHFCVGAPLSRREAPPALVELMRSKPALAIDEDCARVGAARSATAS